MYMEYSMQQQMGMQGECTGPPNLRGLQKAKAKINNCLL